MVISIWRWGAQSSCNGTLEFSYFSWSQLGIITAIKGAGWLQSLQLSQTLLIVSFVLMAALINLLIGSASAKWALLAPIFVPMFYLLGISPEASQVAYRVGDSVTNIITPLMPYFGVVVAYVQRYDREAGVGTMIAMMLPSAAPTVLLAAALNRRSSSDTPPYGSTGLFCLGYLLAWAAFSVLAVLAQWALERSALLSMHFETLPPALTGGLLITAGLWQLTPLKAACLRHCRSPAEFLVQHRRSGPWAALQMGLHHLWSSWGVQLDVVFGSEWGHFAAACAAGVRKWEDGLQLVAHRGRLASEQNVAQAIESTC